jgi:hypothetical protein
MIFSNKIENKIIKYKYYLKTLQMLVDSEDSVSDTVGNLQILASHNRIAQMLT